MPQKRSLKQMEKQQTLREQKAGGRESSRIEKTVGGIDIPDINSKEFLDRLRRMRAITPTQLATQLNVRVSVAKRVLEELRKNGKVGLVSRSRNLKIYVVKSD